MICSFNFLIFLAVCLNISTAINIKILANSNQQTQSYKFTSHIAAFLSVVLITEMLKICIQTSYDQNVQLILKSYFPVVFCNTLTSKNGGMFQRWSSRLLEIIMENCVFDSHAQPACGFSLYTCILPQLRPVSFLNHICWNCLFTSAKLLEDFVKIFMQFYYLRCNENHELDRSLNFNVTNYYIIIEFLWTLRIKDCLLDVKSWKLIIKQLYEDYDVGQRFLFVGHNFIKIGQEFVSLKFFEEKTDFT